MRLAEIEARHDRSIILRTESRPNGTEVPRRALIVNCINLAQNPEQNRPIRRLGRSAYSFVTTRLFFTENTFGTPFARIPARFLSASLSTTPSSVTFPFFTIMWIDGTAWNP